MANTMKYNRGNMEKVRYMYVGQVFKSYRDLCRFLDADIMTGRSKEYNLEELGRYFRWERDKFRYIIQQIYSEPLDIPFFKKETDYTWKSITVTESDWERAIRLLKDNGIKVLSDKN